VVSSGERAAPSLCFHLRMSLLQRLRRQLGLREPADEVVADRAASQEFLDDTHGVIDYRA
jgi:hypothetical protein